MDDQCVDCPFHCVRSVSCPAACRRGGRRCVDPFCRSRRVRKLVVAVAYADSSQRTLFPDRPSGRDWSDAVNGKTLAVNYTGWLYDATRADQKGTQFDTSIGRGPYAFVLGAGQVIKGWDQGVPGMKVGGQRRLVIPPDLAYGASGRGQIPPNATLVFDIQLLAVQ